METPSNFLCLVCVMYLIACIEWCFWNFRNHASRSLQFSMHDVEINPNFYSCNRQMKSLWNRSFVYWIFVLWPNCLSGDDGWGDFGLDDVQKSSPQPKASRPRCNNMQQLYRVQRVRCQNMSSGWCAWHVTGTCSYVIFFRMLMFFSLESAMTIF